MITKAIVESIVDSYSFRVRIPIINRSSDASFHTPSEELYVSSMCTVAGCTPNVRVGDIVYVAFEDNDISKPVVLGYLYRDDMGDTLCDFTLDSLTVEGHSVLSSNTQIGNVSPSEISYLEGARYNIQWQLDLHQADIEALKAGGGGGGSGGGSFSQVQSDWDEADINSPAYIKNKPTNTGTVPSAYCSTSGGVASKVATCTNYVLTPLTYVHAILTDANSALSPLTFNVNNTGARPIYINGTASSSSNCTLPAGTYIAYYDGTAFQFRTDGVLPGAIMKANESDHSASSDSVPWVGIQNRPSVSYASMDTNDPTQLNIIDI